MAARNPNTAQIPGAIWRLWTEFDALEPTALLGGVYAPKTGYHDLLVNITRLDYSSGRDVAADARGPRYKASAIDLSMSDAAMRKYTARLDAAARARDVRLYTPRGPVLREFIGTKDSRSVYCYVLAGGRPLGVGADAGPDPGRDKTHLWHIHLSIIRQFCEDWAALDGVLSVLRGESPAAWRARTEDDMAVGDDIWQLLDKGKRPEGRDQSHSGGVPASWIGAEFHAIKAGLAAQRLQAEAILTAVRGDTDTAAVLARIDEHAAAIKAEVNEVAGETVEALGVEEDPQVIATRLRPVLGDKAVAVGEILSRAE